MSKSRYISVNLDIGHFTAANEDALALASADDLRAIARLPAAKRSSYAPWIGVHGMTFAAALVAATGAGLARQLRVGCRAAARPESRFTHGIPMLGMGVARESRPQMEPSRPAPPRVTVLLPVHDAQPFVAEAVASILAQEFRDFELLAIDDGSRDSSAALLEAMASRDARVRVVRRPHAGLVATLNAGLALARGELIARMDADDVALPGRLARQVERFEREPELVCIGGGFEVMDAAGRVFDRAQPPCDHAAIVARALSGNSPISHSAATYRRDAVRGLGGYDESARGVEDLDLWLRLSEIGALANLPDLVSRVRHHERSASAQDPTAQLEQAARVARLACRRRGLDTAQVQPHAWRALPDRRSQQLLALGRARSAWRIGEHATAVFYALRAIWVQPLGLPLLRVVGHELKASLLRPRA